MSWSTRITGFDQLTPELRMAAHLGVHDGMEVLGVEGTRIVQRNIANPYRGKPPAVAFGNLLRGVAFQVVDAETATILTIGETGVADDYAAPVETGAKAHMPPSAALILWVKKKGMADDEKSAKSLAFVIARSIAKRGTEGHEMFSRGLEELEPMAAPALEKAIATRLAAAGYTGYAQ